jgi:hypothetical protein
MVENTIDAIEAKIARAGSADRMRRCRASRRARYRCLVIEVSNDEIGGLAHRGLLSADDREDRVRSRRRFMASSSRRSGGHRDAQQPSRRCGGLDPEIAREIGDRMPIIERLPLARSIEARPSIVQSGADRHQVLRRVSGMR